MEQQTQKNKYPDNLKKETPDINLPFSKPTLIFSYFNLDGRDYDQQKAATCKICQNKLNIICGGSVNSSYTFILTFHLKTHSKEWNDYLDRLAKNVPDTKTKYEHYIQMTSKRHFKG